MDNVKIKITYLAMAQTEDTQFSSIGQNYSLRHTTSGAVDDLRHPGSPKFLQGDMSLGTLPCSGGSTSGTIDVQFRPRNPDGTRGAWGLIQQRLVYSVTVKKCGEDDASVSLVGFRPDPALVDTPLIQIRSNYFVGPLPPGYPTYPGRPR